MSVDIHAPILCKICPSKFVRKVGQGYSHRTNSTEILFCFCELREMKIFEFNSESIAYMEK